MEIGRVRRGNALTQEIKMSGNKNRGQTGKVSAWMCGSWNET